MLPQLLYSVAICPSRYVQKCNESQLRAGGKDNQMNNIAWLVKEWIADTGKSNRLWKE
jgi:hypothetical protein